MAKTFRILVADDGSPSARAAIELALAFPWPRNSRARGIVALHPGRGTFGPQARAAIIRELHASAAETGSLLSQRWPQSDVVELHEPPAQAILGEQRRFRASTVVLGWRGHGRFRRLVAGSVSRQVVAQAPCPVLVVRAGGAKAAVVRRLVVGFDGSRNARKAIDFIARLEAPAKSEVVLVNVVEPVNVPTVHRLPSTARAKVKRELTRITVERVHRARTQLQEAAAPLESAGWRVKPKVARGEPLAQLLAAGRSGEADVLVVGARGTTGLARAFLGSVAAGALNECPVPVLVVP